MFVKKDDESDSVSKSVTLNMSNVQTAKKSAVAFKTFRDTVLIFMVLAILRHDLKHLHIASNVFRN